MSRNNMNNKIKQIWNAVTTALVAVVVILAMLIWGVQLFGLEVLVVQSGSMEPEYPTGSLVYIREVDPAELKERDVITFELGGGVRGTHRIIELVPDESDPSLVRFRTKGDANDHPDSGLVDPENVVGRVVFGLPLLGYLIAYIQQPPGTYLAMAFGALVLLLTFLPELLFEDGKQKQENP